MGFRTYCSQLWHLGILNILSWRIWENTRSGKVILTSFPNPSSLKDSPIKPSIRDALSLPRGKENCYLWRKRDAKKSPNKLACQISPVVFLRRFSLVAKGLKKKKNPPANAEDTGSIPRSGRSPGKGNGIPLKYPCLGNPMDRGAWWATVHEVAKSWTRLSNTQQQQFLHSCPLFVKPHMNRCRSLPMHIASASGSPGSAPQPQFPLM